MDHAPFGDADALFWPLLPPSPGGGDVERMDDLEARVGAAWGAIAQRSAA